MIEQFLLHLTGDYLLQSDWMALEKTKRLWPAFCHALVYSLPFLLIGSWQAWLVLFLTHLVIDRYRLARYVVYAKNFMAPRSWWKSWAECANTGYHDSRPAWLSGCSLQPTTPCT
jgi:hypothetical protein